MIGHLRRQEDRRAQSKFGSLKPRKSDGVALSQRIKSQRERGSDLTSTFSFASELSVRVAFPQINRYTNQVRT